MFAKLFGSKKLQSPKPAGPANAQALSPDRHQAFLAALDQKLDEFLLQAVPPPGTDVVWGDEGIWEGHRFLRRESPDAVYAYIKAHLDFPNIPPDFVVNALYVRDRSAVLNPHLKMTHIESLNEATVVTRHQVKLLMFKVDSFVAHAMRSTPRGTAGVQMACSADPERSSWKFDPQPYMYLNMTGSIIQPHPTEAGGTRLTMLHKDLLKFKSFFIPKKIRKDLALKILAGTLTKMNQIVREDFATAQAGKPLPPAPNSLTQLGAAAAARHGDESRPSTSSTGSLSSSAPPSRDMLTLAPGDVVERPESSRGPASRPASRSALPTPAGEPATGTQILQVRGIQPEQLGEQLQEVMELVADALVEGGTRFEDLGGLDVRAPSKKKKDRAPAGGPPGPAPEVIEVPPPSRPGSKASMAAPGPSPESAAAAPAAAAARPARMDAHEEALPGSIG
eukprot:tig00021531_g22172.t1